MYQCASCGANIQERQAKCAYCGRAVPPHLRPPTEATAEDMAEAMRKANAVLDQITPWPMKLMMYAVPIIIACVFAFIVYKIATFGP